MLTALIGALVIGQFAPGSSMIRPRAVVSAPTVAVFGDAEVLGAINARDANLIEASTLASTKASDGEAKSLANMILADHKRSLTRGGELAKELNLSRELPPDSAMARKQEQLMDQLSLASGAAFDRAYVQYIFDAHTAELEKLSGTYVPGSQHASVKAFVNERLPQVRAHLAAAERWLAANRQ
jgi:predicted outer membrane protein